MTKRKKITIIAIIVVLLAVLLTWAMVNTRANTTPRVVVERFYGGWIDAFKDPIGPYEQGLHRKSTYVTESYGKWVERQNERGRDAVLCIGTEPVNFVIEEEHINNSGKQASVDFVADGIKGRAVLVQDERGWWRIDEVDCPSIPKTIEAATSTDTTVPAQ